MFKRMTTIFVMLVMLILAGSLFSRPSVELSRQPSSIAASPADLDQGTWIDANKLLMFVTNNGSIAFDNTGLFGKNDGLYFPFTSVDDIQARDNTLSVIFAGSVWIGGVDSLTGDTLVTSAQHSTDWGVGPIVGDSSAPNGATDPRYRVYKLYKDSMESNPNQDYLEWPVADGAPVNSEGKPLLVGDQTLWAVYNDLDVDAHVHNQGTIGRGLGVEVQQTVWAADEAGSDTVLVPDVLRMTQLGNSEVQVNTRIVDRSALTGHDYMVKVGYDIDSIPEWHLLDMTTGDTLLGHQTNFRGDSSLVVDGLVLFVQDPDIGFEEFQVVANGAGPIDPPAAGALDFAGFPVPLDINGFPTRPGDDQQVGAGRWAIHTADNGGSCDGGSRGNFSAFYSRVTRDANNSATIGRSDYEMRFTGSYDQPGVNGSYVIEAYYNDNVFWVPFELWNIGIRTVDDPSDDVRLVPWVIDDGDDDSYNLENWGCRNGVFGGYGEHSASGGDNDPFTDWIYWYTPTDMSPGETGYLANEAQMTGGTYDYTLINYEVFARIVLINWNGGEQPPFNQDLPEEGTVFRIVTGKSLPVDSFTFRADPLPVVTTGNEGTSLYVRYKLINKSQNYYRDFYLESWFDPDLGNANDDMVGCDPADDLFYCYNDGPDEQYRFFGNYGNNPPAVGIKFIQGPIMPSPGDTAYVDGRTIPDYRNLGLSAFQKYIGGSDPDTPLQSYAEMNGLHAEDAANIVPLVNPTTGLETTFFGSGDPVTGTGWVDRNSSDRRMAGMTGPFDFAPGDTQSIVIKIAVGRGADALSSLTKLREILNDTLGIPTDVPGENNNLLPARLTVSQNYPNPFNATTTIKYSLPEKAIVTIDVFNILGQKVIRLVDEAKPAGNHIAVWRGTNARGKTVASGLYFYRVKAGDQVEARKMLLLK